MVRTWLISAIGLLVAAWIVPGAHVNGFWAALLVAAVIAALNAILPPIIAAIRLPLTLVFGFLSILVLDALMLLAADALTDGRMSIDGVLVGAPRGVPRLGGDARARGRRRGRRRQRVLVPRRPAHRAQAPGTPVRTDAPGVVFLEIDGLALPVLRRAMRDGNAPQMARWLAEDGYALSGWETDLSSQTGASQAGILLGSNVDIPAFRWVEKETGDGDVVLRARPTAPSSSGGTRATRGSCSTAAPAAATCSPARPTR